MTLRWLPPDESRPADRLPDPPHVDRVTASRLRVRAPCSRGPRGPGLPRRVMSCGDGSALVVWTGPRRQARVEAEGPMVERAIVLAEPLGPLLAPVRGWDLDAPERAHVGGELYRWPYPGAWGRGALQAPRYWYRPNVEPAPMRAPKLPAWPPGPELAAALRELPRRGLVGGWRRPERAKEGAAA